MVDKTTQLIEKKFQHINSSQQNPDRILVTLRDRENELNTQLKRTKQRKSKTLRKYNYSRIHNKTSTIERKNELRDSEVVKLKLMETVFSVLFLTDFCQDQSSFGNTQRDCYRIKIEFQILYRVYRW